LNISMLTIRNTFHKKLLEKSTRISNTKAWTKAVFNIFAEIAVENDYCCWASKHKISRNLWGKIRNLNASDPYEFMVDICLTKIDWRNEYEKRIEIAIECEWNQAIDELEWDFAKLLHVNAPRKIFVYDSRVNKQKIKEKKLKKMVECYDCNRLFPGDQILLIDLNRKNIKYTCWEITKSKKIREKFCLERSWRD